MKKELSRRDLIGRAGLALGGAMTLAALKGCASENDPCPAPEVCADTAAALKDFPYEKHIPAGFVLDEATTVQEAAYHGYYTGGGCGHGCYSAIIGDLARAGNPFDQLPINFGQFGGGGVAAYGSICGAVLSGVLVINQLVANPTARASMMTALMRWYETHEFPAYTPATQDPAEVAAMDTGTGTAKLLLNWGSEASKPAVTKLAPGSHLCHASVSGWCAGQSPMVNAGGASQADKKARCARVTADVAGKVTEMVKTYLASGALGARSFAAPAVPTTVSDCTTCHGTGVVQHNGTAMPSAASGMSCPSCHGQKLPLNGDTHVPGGCVGCHSP